MSSGFVRDPSRSWQCSEHPTWDCRVRPGILLAVRLDLFFSNFSSKQTTPDIEDIDNVSLGSTANPTFGSSAEANLDLEYAMALVDLITVRLYQVGDIVEGASFNNSWMLLTPATAPPRVAMIQIKMVTSSIKASC